MHPYFLIAAYSVLIVVASLLGGALPRFFRMSHTQMQVILSFVGGLMLGIGLLHMLPHGIVNSSLDWTIGWTMVGLLFMFFLIRTFHFHQHGPVTSGHEDAHAECEHDHSHGHHHEHGPVHELSWLGVAVGLGVHTMIDGIALGVAVMADHRTNPILAPWGIGVFVAIALHKPLDALSITTLMNAGGWSAKSQWLANLSFALMCPFGAALFLLGLQQFTGEQGKLLGMALGFSAGTFLCISLSDLLPEVQFHQHDRLKLSAALLLGVAVAYGIGLLEHPHTHVIPVGESLQPNATILRDVQSNIARQFLECSDPSPLGYAAEPLFLPWGQR